MADNNASNASLALAIPVFEGKSYLSKKYPDKFVDHDKLLTQKQHKSKDACAAIGDWDACNAILRDINVPPGRILLTWGKHTTPDALRYMGALMLQTPPTGKCSEHRKQANASNRLSLASETNLTLARDRKQLEKAALTLYGEFTERNLFLIQLVQPRNIEGLHFAKFKDIPLIGHSGTSLLQAQPYLPYIPVISDDLGGELNNITEITPLDVLELYNYGDNIDLLDVVRVIAPTSKPTKGPLWSFEQPSHIKTISKLKLAEYPLCSRPVLTKLVFADLNVVMN
jgi:hypothetical protein